MDLIYSILLYAIAGCIILIVILTIILWILKAIKAYLEFKEKKAGHEGII